MELLQLKYFQRVAQLQHMSKAAASLHISQPALSKTIRQLEQELGVSLFHRKGRRISLNEHGEMFLHAVNESLFALECGKKNIQEPLETKKVIRLAVLSASHLLPTILTAFRKQHPDITFRLIQQEKEEFDLCITSHFAPYTAFNITPLLKEELFLGVPSYHSLASKNDIHLIEAKDEEWITLSKGKDLRERTNLYCQLAGFTPQIVFESDSPSTVRGLIHAGQGISLIPQKTWGIQTDEYVTLLKIKEPTCSRTIGLVSPSYPYESTTIQLFKNFILDYFQSI